MRHIERNPVPKNKTNPESLDNTRPPSDYKAALIKDHNTRWKRAFYIDPAKARIISVRQNSFRKWEASVVVGEDIYTPDGKYSHVNQHSANIVRSELPLGVTKIERAKDETAFDTWKKVEKALNLEDNELVAILDLSNKATGATYQFSGTSLNHYGSVRVAFTYAE